MIPMSRPAVPIALAVCWTQAQETAAVKAAQRPAPRLGPIAPSLPTKPRVLAVMRQQGGRQWTQRQLSAAIGRTHQGVHKALKELVREGAIDEIDTKNCTRDGPRFVYVLAVPA